jgi:hypothetical protein
MGLKDRNLTEMFKVVSRIILLILFLLYLPQNIFGFEKEVGPFKAGEKIRALKMNEWEEVEVDPEYGYLYGCKKINDKNFIHLYMKEKDHNPKNKSNLDNYLDCVELLDSNRKKIAEVSGVIGVGMTKGVYSADLNGDGKNDYIVALGTGGNDFFGEYAQLVIFLSTKTSYKIYVLDDSFFDVDDFMNLSNDGKTEIVVSTIIRDAGVKNENPDIDQYFLLYNLFLIDGDQIRLANEIDHRFPGFFSYVYPPPGINHEETKLLNLEQKKDLFLKYTPGILTIPGKDNRIFE